MPERRSDAFALRPGSRARASRANAVEIMRAGEHECTNDRECAISCQTEMGMSHGGADGQRHHAGRTGADDSQAAVPPEAEPQRDDTERQDDDQHLQMQVPLGELRKERQARDENRQGQAVNQAQG